MKHWYAKIVISVLLVELLLQVYYGFELKPFSITILHAQLKKISNKGKTPNLILHPSVSTPDEAVVFLLFLLRHVYYIFNL